MRAVHVEVDKEHEAKAIVLLHKALCTTIFKRSTNLTMKLVPLFSDRLPSAEQDAIHRTITKQALCLAEFEFVSNPHINLLDESSVALHNHSLCTIVLAYCHFPNLPPTLNQYETSRSRLRENFRPQRTPW